MRPLKQLRFAGRRGEGITIRGESSPQSAVLVCWSSTCASVRLSTMPYPITRTRRKHSDACGSKPSPSCRNRKLYTAGLDCVISAASVASNTDMCRLHSQCSETNDSTILFERESSLQALYTARDAKKFDAEEKCQDMCRCIILECNQTHSLTPTVFGAVQVASTGGMQTMTTRVEMALVTF